VHHLLAKNRIIVQVEYQIIIVVYLLSSIHVSFIDEDLGQCLSRSGCLGLFCSRCIEQQNLALGQVQKLMERLEYAESLFPSSRAFAVQYPLFKSLEFTNRVKV